MIDLKNMKLNVAVGYSQDGHNDLQRYLTQYCGLAERIWFLRKFVNRRRNTLSNYEMGILDIIISNANTCLDQCMFEDCDRHIKEAFKKACKKTNR